MKLLKNMFLILLLLAEGNFIFASPKGKKNVTQTDKEQAGLAAALKASLDQDTEIAQRKEYIAEAERLRENRSNLISYPLLNQKIICVRSLAQANGWLCGHYVLFNAQFISSFLLANDFGVRGFSVNLASLLKDIFSPMNYKTTDFSQFYNNVSIKAYFKPIGPVNVNHPLVVDRFSGLKCIDPKDSGVNYLGSEQLAWVSGRRATSPITIPHFYTLRVLGQSGVDFALAEWQKALIAKINECGGTEGYLAFLRNTLKGKFAINFACQIGDNHWILVSVINCFRNIYDPIIVIMDSLNGASLIEGFSTGTEKFRYVDFLRRMFLENRAGWRPVRSEF